MIHPSDIGARRFAHQAMNTEFEIFCVHDEPDYAQQAAWAAFDLLDRMENDLSRFIPNSDISRINHLEAGESVRVSRWTMECLELARQAYQETGGAFDISLGSGLDGLQFSPREMIVGLGAAQSQCGLGLSADAAGTSARATSAIRLDLGGIGKGYAVDRMAEVLDEWDIRQALIHGGHSSVLALDAPCGLDGWPLTMGERTVAARRRAFSASGIRTQGDHIVDPRTGQPAGGRVAAWVSLELDGSPSPSAVAEAYSTAFMILPASEVDAIRSRRPGLEVWFLE
jgi:thiamine biosynthesis lipoprotein